MKNTLQEINMPGWKITIFDRRYIFKLYCKLLFFHFHVLFLKTPPENTMREFESKNHLDI